MTTLHEIARLSGVGKSTVSRVINGSAGVSDETRDRVLAVVEELKYTPNGAARTVRRRQSGLVAAVFDNGTAEPFQQPFFQSVLDGLKRALNADGYDLLLLTKDQTGGFRKRAHYFSADAVVMMGVSAGDPDVDQLVAEQLPAVAIDARIEGPRAGYVTSDNVDGAVQAVAHFHALGRRRIAIINGLANTWPAQERLAGFRAAMRDWGMAIAADFEQRGDFYHQSGYEAMRRLLSKREPPDAVFASSDMMALGALQALQEQGVQVPDEVAVVGFDDNPFARWCRPSLTTLRQDGALIGETAGRAVTAMVLRDAPPPAIRLPVELIVRDSTTPRRPERVGGVSSLLRGGDG
ncbi:MAG TPA: LacI family DNA-binding transcriptional regulator [Acidothermaceae bacterium]